jgi:hypothetical protein
MATVMSHLNVSIFGADKKLTHWRGSPAFSGGALKMVNSTPVGGPPQMDWDTSGKDREPYEFAVETDILGATKTEQDAFIAVYKPGTSIPADTISGAPPGINFVIAEANPTHNDGEEASRLAIRCVEVGSLDGAVTPPAP